MSNSFPQENSVHEFVRKLRESASYKDIIEETIEITDKPKNFSYDNSISTCYQYDTISISNMCTSTTSPTTMTYISGSGSGYAPTYTMSTSGNACITSTGVFSTCIPSIGTINLTGLFGGEEWCDRFPDFDKIQKMCEEYPALKIAFEKFKTTYKLVRDHYDTPEAQRPRP